MILNRRFLAKVATSTIFILAFAVSANILALAADLTVDDILAKGKAKFENTTTLSVTVNAEMVDASTKKSTKMGMKVLADKDAGLSRITFIAPAAFKDQVMIIDQKANVMKMYMPVTNQVMVTKLGKGSAPASGMGMGSVGNFSDLMKLPDKTTHDVKLVGKDKLDKVDAYVVSAKSKKDPKSGSQKIWLSVSDLTPLKIEMFDEDGKSTGSMDFQDFKTGIKVDRKKLVFIPSNAEVIEG